jgi:hypothetical protein
LGCGQLSVGGEVANRVTISDVIRDGAAQWVLSHQRGVGVRRRRQVERMQVVLRVRPPKGAAPAAVR